MRAWEFIKESVDIVADVEDFIRNTPQFSRIQIPSDLRIIGGTRAIGITENKRTPDETRSVIFYKETPIEHYTSNNDRNFELFVDDEIVGFKQLNLTSARILEVISTNPSKVNILEWNFPEWFTPRKGKLEDFLYYVVKNRNSVTHGILKPLSYYIGVNKADSSYVYAIPLTHRAHAVFKTLNARKLRYARTLTNQNVNEDLQQSYTVSLINTPALKDAAMDRFIEEFGPAAQYMTKPDGSPSSVEWELRNVDWNLSAGIFDSDGKCVGALAMRPKYSLVDYLHERPDPKFDKYAKSQTLSEMSAAQGEALVINPEVPGAYKTKMLMTIARAFRNSDYLWGLAHESLQNMGFWVKHSIPLGLHGEDNVFVLPTSERAKQFFGRVNRTIREEDATELSKKKSLYISPTTGAGRGLSRPMRRQLANLANSIMKYWRERQPQLAINLWTNFSWGAEDNNAEKVFVWSLIRDPYVAINKQGEEVRKDRYSDLRTAIKKYDSERRSFDMADYE